jgi:hypothetical protein
LRHKETLALDLSERFFFVRFSLGILRTAVSKDDMPRIQKAFERRFRELFAELGARDREKGLAWIHSNATRLANRDPADRATTLSHAYTKIAISILDQTRSFRERRRPLTQTQPRRVHCDAGLGGLARWLRALGCEALWRQDITDADLVGETQRFGGILLTTDSLLLDRRAYRSR